MVIIGGCITKENKAKLVGNKTKTIIIRQVSGCTLIR